MITTPLSTAAIVLDFQVNSLRYRKLFIFLNLISL